jgi:hypothetical protein
MGDPFVPLRRRRAMARLDASKVFHLPDNQRLQQGASGVDIVSH